MAIRIYATQARRFRAGHQFGRMEQTFSDDHFTDEQLAQIQADKCLVVQQVPDEEADSPAKASSKGKAGRATQKDVAGAKTGDKSVKE